MRNGKNHIDMELLDLTELQKVLQDFATDIRDRYRDVLANNDHIASKKLFDSIKTQVVVGDNAYEVTMTLEDYWKYVEEGVKGLSNPSSPFKNPGWKAFPHILKWVEVKPVIPRPGNNDKIPTPKQLAFLITRSIVTEGTHAYHPLEKTKDDILPWWREQISQALGHDMENYIRKLVRE